MNIKIKNILLLFIFALVLIFNIGIKHSLAACSPACSTPGFTCVAGTCMAVSHTPPPPSSTTSDPTIFTNPLTYTNVDQLLSGILGAIQKIIVVLALVFIMIGAVMILTSAGSSGMVEQGKKAITMALVGLALGVAAPSLLKELSTIIGWNTGASTVALTVSQIAVNVLNFLLGSMGILALIMLVIGAIMYLTSAGDEDRIEKGKEIFKFALIGLVLAMSAMVLVVQIAKFFVSTSPTTAATGATSATVRKPMPAVPAAAAVSSGADPATACQGAGYASELCTVMDSDPSRSGQYLMPVGMDCTWRNVCPNSPMQGCCKPE